MAALTRKRTSRAGYAQSTPLLTRRTSTSFLQVKATMTYKCFHQVKAEICENRRQIGNLSLERNDGADTGLKVGHE